MLKSLQAGRAVAAVSVAAFHLSLMMGESRYGGEEIFGKYTHFGGRGVDFFFVLSGFIILFAHVKDIGNPIALPRYLWRRFIRLYPIYWLYTICFAGVFAVIGGTQAAIPNNFADWLTSLSLIRFTAATPPLPVAWTLFHEVAFYAIFSILILNGRLGIAAFVVISVLSIVIYHYPQEANRTAATVYTSAYNLYFVFGMAAFWLFRRGGSGTLELLTGILVFAVAMTEVFSQNGIQRGVMGFGMALILTAAVKYEASGKISIPSFLSTIGDASYTIYLIHENVQGSLLKAANAMHLQNNFGPHLTYLFALFGSIIVGCLVYIFLEKPVVGFFRNIGFRFYSRSDAGK